MITRLLFKLRQVIHYLLNISIYYNSGVILRGVPKIIHGKNIEFSRNVRINENVFLHASNGIKIGENTTISYGACIISESYDLSKYELYIKRTHSGKEIKIGKNVWICANVTILPGITISDNIIVAAGSIVNKNLDKEFGIYAGNPARFIKYFGKVE